MFSNLIDRVGNHNPQLFREIKSKITPSKVIFTAIFSFLAQLTFCVGFLGQLPGNINSFSNSALNRYCTGISEPYEGNLCVKNLLGKWEIRWEIWWLDLFFGLSVICVFILLLVGTYLLIIDFIQEDKKGTLNFIRLSPIKGKDFFTGKMLGVPSLVLLFVSVAMPLHFYAGLHSNISPELILVFYLLVGISCAFFYSSALLFASIIRNYSILSALLATFVIFVLLTNTTPYFAGNVVNARNVAWFAFDPLIFLDYLAESAQIYTTISGYSVGSPYHILWYTKPIWGSAWGMFFTLSLNYIWWTYIIRKALERVYNTPKSTIFTKLDSYLITSSYIFIWFGFMPLNDSSEVMRERLFLFQLSLSILFVVLIASISPDRQTLFNWSHYRHNNRNNLLKDLIIGEKSPSVVAMIINSLLILCYYMTILLTLSLPAGTRLGGLLSLISQMTTLCIFALIVQLMLMTRVKRKVIMITSVFALLTIFLMLTLVILLVLTGVVFYMSPVGMIMLDSVNWLGFSLTLILESLVFGSLSLVLKGQLHKFSELEPKLFNSMS